MSAEEKSKINEIKWAVRVGSGNMTELAGKKGEKIILDIKSNWENDDISVMAYIEGTGTAGTGTNVLIDPYKGKLIRGVVGDDEAFVGQKAEYEATGYNEDGDAGRVSSGNGIKWAIKIGESGSIDKEKLKSKEGNKIISLEMESGWAGKDIFVMPYLNSPTPTVSVKTRVERLELPKVIIETKRVEGKEEDGSIARDMYFGLKVGNAHAHTNNFTLGQINGDDAIELRSAITRDLACSDEELSSRFDKLILWTSKYPLQIEIREMANKMKRLKINNAGEVEAYKNSLETHSFPAITNAVFMHEETERFRNRVKIYAINEVIKEAIKHHNGNISKIEKKIVTEVDYRSDNPKYSSFDDLKNGLQIAINDTWGHRVEIVDYEYDANSKKFNAKLKIRIFDHFGLDYGDIEKFGTAKLVRPNLPNIVHTAEYIMMHAPHIFIGPILTLEAAIHYLTSKAAQGFRAWFILQHYRGYRPFVNIMEEEIEIEGQL